jgi:hypothetical protein
MESCVFGSKILTVVEVTGRKAPLPWMRTSHFHTLALAHLLDRRGRPRLDGTLPTPPRHGPCGSGAYRIILPRKQL